MEEHPLYAQTIADIEARGYKVVLVEGTACVVVREVVNLQGIPLQIEREMQIRPGMTFIDLEHEVGHLDQIEYQLKEEMLPTERVLESGRQSSDRRNLYEDWMNDISEYHNRLVEYKRLYERGVDVDVLEAHVQGARIWREEYKKIIRVALRGSSRAAQRVAWGYKFFPDIAELEMFYREAGGNIFESDLR